MNAFGSLATAPAEAGFRLRRPAKTQPVYTAIIYKLFMVFVIGSFVGFVVETAWCFLQNGRIEFRSSIIGGPFNFVYGFGATVMHLCLSRIDRKKKLLIFAAGFLAGTVVEFFCSLFQEVIFGTISWDYSDMWLNIGGRVCLFYSVFWGILALAWIYIIYPLFEKIIEKIPVSLGKNLAKILLLFFLVTSALSGAAVTRWMSRQDGISPKDITGQVIDAIFPDSRMETFYPNMMTAQREAG